MKIISSFVPVFFLACSGPKGTVQIFVTPETTISEGIAPGSEEDTIQDGWTVSYDKFLVSIGDFRSSSDATTVQVNDDEVYVADLKQIDAAGEVFVTFENIEAKRYGHFSYSFLTSAKSMPVGNVSNADLALMREHTLYVVGSITKPGETPITFRLGYKGATRFGECAAEEGGPSGYAVTEGGTVAVKPTLHGDHWFFTSDPHTTTPKRLAQWMATADANGDKEVTTEELKAQTNIAALFPASAGYNFSGLPVQPIQNAFHYFGAMARTLGHFNGDGHCEDIRVLSKDPSDPAALQVD